MANASLNERELEARCHELDRIRLSSEQDLRRLEEDDRRALLRIAELEAAIASLESQLAAINAEILAARLGRFRVLDAVALTALLVRLEERRANLQQRLAASRDALRNETFRSEERRHRIQNLEFLIREADRRFDRLECPLHTRTFGR